MELSLLWMWEWTGCFKTNLTKTNLRSSSDNENDITIASIIQRETMLREKQARIHLKNKTSCVKKQLV